MELHSVQQDEEVQEPAECEVRSEGGDASVAVDWSQVVEHARQTLLRATVLVAGGTARFASAVASAARLVQGEARKNL